MLITKVRQRHQNHKVRISQNDYVIFKSKSKFKHSSSQGKSKVTAAEIEAMGRKVPDSMKSSQNNSLPSNTMVTDDEIGNGESIFDF